MRRHLPTLLLVASLPAGVLGYAAGAAFVRSVLPGLADGVVMLFVPLLVGGLCMVPFIAPFLDARAKADLAAYRARQAEAGHPGDPTDATDSTDATDAEEPEDTTPSAKPGEPPA